MAKAKKKLTPSANKKDYYKGNLSAPLVLVVYGDFECDDTKAALPIIEKLRKDFGDKLLFVFRHFPLTDVKNIHPHANQSHVASEIAAEKGKFWEMYEKLFKYQTKLERTDFAKYLNAIGVKIPWEEFEEQMKLPKYWDKVKQTVKNGVKNGVTGTPRFFINGSLYQGEETYSALKKALQSSKNK